MNGRKFFLWCAAFSCVMGLMAGAKLYAQTGNTVSDVVFVRQYGNYRNDYASLTAAVGRIGTRERTLVIDGAIVVSNDILFPTNLNLFVSPNGSLDPATGVVVTVSGTVASGNWKIFGGLGIATGRVANTYVEQNWSDTNLYYLGPSWTSLATQVYVTNQVALLSNGLWIAITNGDSRVSNGVMAYAVGLSNALYAVITNEGAVVSNGMKMYVDTNFLSRTTTVEMISGQTLVVDKVSYSNYPAIGVSLADSGGQLFDNAVANHLRLMTNFATVYNNNYTNDWGQSWSNSLGGSNEMFRPAKSGIWRVQGNYTVRYRGTGRSPESVEFFLIKNALLNSDATNNLGASIYLGQIEPSTNLSAATAVLFGELNCTTSTPASASTPYTNIWRFYMRADNYDSDMTSAFGAVSFSYVGDPTLSR